PSFSTVTVPTSMVRPAMRRTVVTSPQGSSTARADGFPGASGEDSSPEQPMPNPAAISATMQNLDVVFTIDSSDVAERPDGVTWGAGLAFPKHHVMDRAFSRFA